MSKSNLYAACTRQWATRPADERFWTLADARAACKRYADTAEEHDLDFGAEALLVAEGDNLALTLDGGRGNRLATFTNWGFGQVARMAGAPAEYLRKLPPHLAAQCVEAGLDKHFAGREDMTCKALVHDNGTTVLRALTSDKYSRFWNWEVFERLCGLEQQGWRVPPGRPAKGDDPSARPATEADCLNDRMAGLGIKPGDPIACRRASTPATMTCSRSWSTRSTESTTVRTAVLARGFFVQNSEVGASALRVTFFHYRHVCGNHIVWDASNVIEVAVRHVGDVGGRFHVELAASVQKYLTASAPRWKRIA